MPEQTMIAPDPDLQRFQAAVVADWARLLPPGETGIAQIRRAAERVRARWSQGGPEMCRTTDLMAGGIRLRIHEPGPGSGLAAFVYLHGGGWSFFSIDTHDRLMREYAARAGVAVIGVDYALAPETVFPRQIGQVVEVVDWLRGGGAGPAVDPARLAIGGDSAGANLAVAAALTLREAGKALPGALLLNYGAFDTAVRDSHRLYGGPGSILTAGEMAELWQAYLGNAGGDDSLARPLRADLRGLPPTFLCIAEQDILADENCEMARRLEEAGVPVESHVYAGAIHGFLEAVSISALAGCALQEASGWLRRRLAA